MSQHLNHASAGIATAIGKGLLGVISAGTGIQLSLSPLIQPLQAVSLVLGITIAAATLVSIYQKASPGLQKLILAILTAAIVMGCVSMFSGCVVYRHSRHVSITSTNGDRYESRESTPLITLFQKGEADMVRTTTTDNRTNYTRSVGLDAVKASGDPASIKATGTAAGQIGHALIKGQ